MQQIDVSEMWRFFKTTLILMIPCTAACAYNRGHKELVLPWGSIFGRDLEGTGGRRAIAQLCAWVPCRIVAMVTQGHPPYTTQLLTSAFRLPGSGGKADGDRTGFLARRCDG